MPRLILLLLPSLASATVTLIATLLVLGSSAWSYISNNQLFYDSIFGLYGFKTLLNTSDTFSSIQYVILNGRYTYYILVIACALIVGGTTYVLLESLRRATQDTTDDLQQITDSQHKEAARTALTRLVLRIASALGWAVYIVAFVSLLMPFTIVQVETAIDMLHTNTSLLHALLYGLESFAILFVGIHAHVVFARLCMLRPRLLGGDHDIEEAAHHKWQ